MIKLLKNVASVFGWVWEDFDGEVTLRGLYFLFFPFPLAVYMRVGEIRGFRFFGIMVWAATSNLHRFLWFNYMARP